MWGCQYDFVCECMISVVLTNSFTPLSQADLSVTNMF